jgi:hypothetical protein
MRASPTLRSEVKVKAYMDSVQMTLSSPSHYRDAHLDVDFNGRSATLDTQRLVLTRKEYELLLLLVQNAGEIIPREAHARLGFAQRDAHAHPRYAYSQAAQEARGVQLAVHRNRFRNRLQISAVPHHPDLPVRFATFGGGPHSMMCTDLKGEGT